MPTDGSYSNQIIDLVKDKYHSVDAQIKQYFELYEQAVQNLMKSFDCENLPTKPEDYCVIEDFTGDVEKPEPPDINVDLDNVNTGKPAIPQFLQETFKPSGPPPKFKGERPNITLPEAPKPHMPNAPGTAPGISQPAKPTRPVLPSVQQPTMHPVNIPQAPAVSIPWFNGEMPVFTELPPEVSLDYSEEEFASDLYACLTSRIKDICENGGTGIDPEYFDLIYNKARTALDQERGIRHKEVMEYFASRGFCNPPGSVNSALREVDRQFEIELGKLAEGITAKNLELAYQAAKDFTMLGIQYDSEKHKLWDARQNRLFMVAKELRDGAIQLYNMQVMLYNAKLEAYKTYAAVYATMIQAEGLKVEIYKSEVTAAGLVTSINRSEVDLYTAKLNANTQIIAVYEADIRATMAELEADRLRIAGFREEVNAYTAQISAITTQYQAYESQVRAEVSKIQLYDADVRAYMGLVQSYTSEVNSIVSQYNALNAYNTNQSMVYKAQTDAFIAEAGLVDTTNKIRLSEKELEVKNFTALMDAANTELNAKLEEYKIEQTAKISSNESQSKIYAVDMSAAVEQLKLGIAILQGNVETTAQLLASAMASLNTTVGGGWSGSSADNHYFDEKKEVPSTVNQHNWYEG